MKQQFDVTQLMTLRWPALLETCVTKTQSVKRAESVLNTSCHKST